MTQPAVPLLDLQAQFAEVADDVRRAVDEVFAGQHFVLGPPVRVLEEALARLCAVPCAVGVGSGTDALLLALRAAGVERGDDVITVPFTFFATAGAIWNLGARPVFVDVRLDDFNLDPDRLTERIEADYARTADGTLRHKATGNRLSAILPVHLFGQCARMEPIGDIAREAQVPVIEDAAQSIDAHCPDREGALHPAGSLGDAGCISFYPTKNLSGAGEGGMVVTRSADLAQKVRMLRNHGMEPRYVHTMVGTNSRLDSLQAAVLLAKLPHLRRWSAARHANAMAYHERLARSAACERGRLVLPVPRDPRPETHVFNQFTLRVTGGRRDAFRAHLADRGIGSDIYYPIPLHLQQCFASLGHRPNDFPVAEQLAGEVVSIPIYPQMTADQRERVIEALEEFAWS